MSPEDPTQKPPRSPTPTPGPIPLTLKDRLNLAFDRGDPPWYTRKINEFVGWAEKRNPDLRFWVDPTSVRTSIAYRRDKSVILFPFEARYGGILHVGDVPVFSEDLLDQILVDYVAGHKFANDLRLARTVGTGTEVVHGSLYRIGEPDALFRVPDADLTVDKEALKGVLASYEEGTEIALSLPPSAAAFFTSPQRYVVAVGGFLITSTRPPSLGEGGLYFYGIVSLDPKKSRP